MILLKEKEFIPFLTEKDILDKVAFLGSQITGDYAGRCPVLIGVLNGSFMFLSDLAKQIEIPVEISFVKISSYLSTASTGKVNKLIGLEIDLLNREVIIVEDIVDSGKSISFLLNMLGEEGPKNIAVASLLSKPHAHQENILIKYLGFEIPDKFVIGYGLDYNGQGRNLREIYQLK